MIVYHKHHEIDKEQWDDCILNSPGVKPYAYSWYLDIMAPGWEALIDDDYDAVFPIPCRRKFGIQYIATPIFLQQLGAFSPDKSQSVAIAEFLDYMPKFYKLIDLCIGQKVNTDSFRVTLMDNFELDMSRSYEKILEGFSHHCRRNIKISARIETELVSDISPDEIINLFLKNKGREIKGIKILDYRRIRNLMYYCIENKKGRILGVRTSGRRLIFGVFVIETDGNKTMLFVVNTPQSRDRRIGYYVINEIIKENSATKTILDFAGSSIPSIASFMKSFGAINNPYYRIYQNGLFWPLKLMR